MKNQFYIFVLALQFLTRLPVSSNNIYSNERMSRIAAYFPLVGALVGLIIAATLALLAQVLPWVFSVIGAISMGLLLTGAFHEDGLADTFDGLGGSHKPERALEIMRDSRIGTYGTLALVCALGLKVSALVEMPPPAVFAVIVCAHTLSRLSSVVVIATSEYVRQEGTGKPVAKGVTSFDFWIATITSAGILVISALLLPIDFGLLSGITGALIAHVVVRVWIQRRIAGYTGDTLGTIQQCSEIGFYTGALITLV